VASQARWLGDISPFGKCDCQSALLRDVNEVRVVWPTLSILPPFTSEVLPYFREGGLLLLARPPSNTTRPALLANFYPTSLFIVKSDGSSYTQTGPNPAYRVDRNKGR
jgi:hypothetical protein